MAAAGTDESIKTLVLGMTFVNDSYRDTAADGTTSAPLRDRARLIGLEATGRDIISMNMAQTAAECAPHKHLQGHFGRRPVRELIEKFGADGRLVLDEIFCDYVRFPAGYMLQAYGPVVREMIPALVQSGVMGPHTQLILPNYPGLLDSLVASDEYTAEPIAAEEYPLYVVTGATDGALPGSTNEHEIEQLQTLDQVTGELSLPFVRFRLS